MTLLLQLQNVFYGVFQRHAWTYASKQAYCPRTCRICGEYQEASEDEWGPNYGTLRSGVYKRHASLLNGELARAVVEDKTVVRHPAVS